VRTDTDVFFASALTEKYCETVMKLDELLNQFKLLTDKNNTVIRFQVSCTDKKENQIFLIYKEIQSGAVAKSYMRKGVLIYEEMRKYFPKYEEAVSHI
jgi:hypothetical protein